MDEVFCKRQLARSDSNSSIMSLGGPESACIDSVPSAKESSSESAPSQVRRLEIIQQLEPVPQSAATQSGGATLEQLLRLSSADGSFKPSPKLVEALRVTEEAVETWKKDQWPPTSAVDLQVLFTALVVAALQVRFGEQSSTWSLAGEKATAWLRARESQWRCAAVADMEALVRSAVQKLAE